MQLASLLQTSNKYKIARGMLCLFVDGALFSSAAHGHSNRDCHDANEYAFLLQESSNKKSLIQGKLLHARILVAGFNQNVLLGTKLAAMYAVCGNTIDARAIFDKLSERNAFLYNMMIRGYACHGPAKEALAFYYQMQGMGMQPDNFTFPFVLKACAALAALEEGKEIHCHTVRSGFESDVYVGNALISMYAKCGAIEVAYQLFDKMSEKSAVSWHVLIAGYAQNGQATMALTLFDHMQMAGVKPNPATIVNVLRACAHLSDMERGKDVHDYIIQNSFDSDVFVKTALVDMYAKCGRVEIARQLFDKMSERDMVSWNAMIAGYVQNGFANEALTLFHQMELAYTKPSLIAVVSVLRACAQLADLQKVKDIHDYIMKNRIELDVFVETALIDMYVKCGSVRVARQLFDKMSKRDMVSWNAMIAGYAHNGFFKEALALFHQMQLEDMKPNKATIVSILPACTDSTVLQEGKHIHDYIIKNRFESDVSVGNSLVAMYAKCGSLDVARQLFDNMFERNVVSWNAMIAGYAQNGLANEALSLFHQMRVVDAMPDHATMVSVLRASAHLAALQQSKGIHGYIIKSGFEPDVFVATALIDTYAKCGSLEFARKSFDKMSKRDVVSWSAMIAGYGMHGHGEDALALFSRMQQTGMEPDYITFTHVLCACSHAGLVDKGWQYFECMSRYYSITPRVDHYACMVDLLGRAGRLDEAHNFIIKMPLEPNAGVWGALLGACRIHCNIELGECVAEYLFDLEPEDAGNYVLLSNIYAAAGRWDDVARVRTMMKARGVKKTPGCSLIELNNRVHTFVVGDKSHPQSEQIYEMLHILAGKMEVAGYVPNTNLVLHDVEDEVKEHMLCSHSEKLAIAFGLINTSPGTPIHITKNIRVCGDCHSASKFISKIARREIIMRDANRFHHFNDGLCSCNDYW